MSMEKGVGAGIMSTESGKAGAGVRKSGRASREWCVPSPEKRMRSPE
ncbi:hypothetical protein [Bacillus litorisediminis]|nr:hypothetical protein [Bacillus litorisediminis]